MEKRPDPKPGWAYATILRDALFHGSTVRDAANNLSEYGAEKV